MSVQDEHPPGVPTPALIVDASALEANQILAEKMFREAGKTLRPHIKTHRTPELAMRQLGPASTGVTCATVGEAEVMAASEVQDVLIANEIVSPGKIERVCALASSGVRVAVALDAIEPALALSSAAERAGATVNVLIDLDVGLGRCGVRDLVSARALASAVDGARNVRLMGIMGYEGRLRASTESRGEKSEHAQLTLAKAKGYLESAGFPVEVVSAGGTSTLRENLASPVVTEVQAGSYLFMEPDLEGLDLPFGYAAYVMATVISHSRDRVVVDAGRKTVGCDYGPPLCISEGGRTASVSEEHTVLMWEASLPRLGSQVCLRPTHIRTTFNLHDFVYLVRDGYVEERLSVAARGRSQ